MRVGDTVLASAFVFAAASAAFGQNPGQNPDAAISKILDIAQSGNPAGNAAAKAKYVVDGLAVGAALKTDSAAYREYKCGPSEQFDGLTWCQKTKIDWVRRGPFTATFSLLHARDGSVIYVNRRQEPSFLDRGEADKDVREFSRKLGSEARITRMPRRGERDGVIALWGETTLEPLDADSIKVLAEGRSPKKGLLVDFLGNFARSAKEGLPIYRISGGAGFVWAAGFGEAGRGALRFAAVDASALPSPSPAQATTSSLPAQAPSLASAAAEPALPLPQVLPQVQQVDVPDAGAAGLKQTIATPKAELRKSAGRIAQLEKEKAVTGSRAGLEATRLAADDGQLPDRATLEAAIAQLKAEKAALEAKTRTWAIASLGAIIGLIVFMVLFVPGRLMRSRKTAERDEPELAPGRDIAPEQATKPGKIDEGNLIHQLAETLGVEETAVSLPQLAPAPSASLVPAAPVASLAPGEQEAAAPGKNSQDKNSQDKNSQEKSSLVKGLLDKSLLDKNSQDKSSQEVDASIAP